MRPALSRFLDRARGETARFLDGLRRGREVQRDLLHRIIATNANTAFGRDHGFASIATLDDYRRAVPLRSYEALRPYIDRAFAGAAQVLTAADPVLYFATTGTTGAPKRVPVTREAFAITTNNLLVYWAALGERYPRVLERDDAVVMLHLAPKPYGELSPTGVPVVNPTHVPSPGKGAFPYSWAPWFPPPPELSDAERLYFFLRSAVEHPLVGFLCLHPSRMHGFAARLAQDAPRLVQELHDGTVCGTRTGDANPTRARELEALLRAGPIEPRHVWPQLEFVACWYGGSFPMYRPGIEQKYGAPAIPQMSASSEAGQLTLPIDGEPMDGPLTVHANHYEFIPVSDEAEDATSPEHLARWSEATLPFEALELGRSYELVFTSPAGLYRYASGDRFQVLGFVHGVPRLGFVGRGGIVDMTGEKVSEQHVQTAIDRTLAALGVTTVNATCCAVLAEPAHYVFVFEPAAPWDAAQQQRAASTLDTELRALNSRYELKRGFGDLAAAQVRIAPRGAFDKYRASLIARGAPGSQLKDKVLQTDPAVLARLTEP